MQFVDTSVLVYAIAREESERTKRVIANELLEGRDLALSAQVLQEFYVQATRANRSHALTHTQATELVEAFARFPVQPTTVGLVLAAMETRDRFGISYWDAAIVEAARALGCAEVLSEDLSHGQDFDGVRVLNPFR